MCRIWNRLHEPKGRDQKVYLVVDGFGRDGRVFQEADVETTVNGLMSGTYSDPVRVVAVNTAEGRAKDESEHIAWEILRRADMAGHDLPASIEEFVDSHLGWTGGSH